jgi:hypothetical protein
MGGSPARKTPITNRCSTKREFSGADLTVSWFFGKIDIPHKIKEVWMSEIEPTRIPRFSAKSKHQKRLQIWNKKVL